MLNRMTKATSLLIAATSIISMVPAMAADVQKIDAQEGTIYYGKAKGNGVFIIDGQINGKDNDSVYYLADGKYNELTNADSGDDISGDIFEKKYVEFDNGDYYIDVTTGDKTDESIAENWHDDIAESVRKKLKNDNDGRIADSSFDGIVQAKIGTVSGKEFMLGAMGNWSEFQYDLENSNVNGVTKTSIYSGPDGNYIDADYNLGNFNVATTGDAVVIKNTDDTYEITKDGVDYEVKAQIDSSTPLSEGYDYILRSAKISVWGRNKAVGGSYTNMTSQFKYGSKSKNYDIANGNSYVDVFQKISKAQSSDDIDGIKYAKDTSTYFKTDSDGKTQTLYYGWSTNSAGIVNWKAAGTKYYAQEAKLKSEKGFYYTDLGDSDNVDIDASSIGGGMLYCLSDGYIKMWDNVDSFVKLYKVDGSMNKISASNKDNIIVWNEDDEVYSIIANNKPAATNTAATTNANSTTTATVGWAQGSNGTWTYSKADGTKATGWLKDGSSWYFLKNDGIMATEWIMDKGTWYYLNKSGAMQTGWVNDNGTWYYCNASGEMLANTTVDGYVLGANGAWVK